MNYLFIYLSIYKLEIKVISGQLMDFPSDTIAHWFELFAPMN